MPFLNIDDDFYRWFENEFADNIDEGSRTHTNLHSAFEAGVKLGVEGALRDRAGSINLVRDLLADDFERLMLECGEFS